jgi:phosphoribosyl 1,2-cyclic phosphodiesterase
MTGSKVPMEICVLASSSSGNATAIRCQSGILLIDAGLSGKEVQRRLEVVGWRVSDVSSIILTHEHSDHTKGAGILARRLGVPVYGTAGTLEALASLWRGGEILRPVSAGTAFELSGFEVEPFATPHDVAEPVQYVIRRDGFSFGIATDLGKVTTLVRQKLRGTDVAMIEANHDQARLRWGEYPWKIKQRIASPHGHLSNEAACLLAVDLAANGVRHIVLGHLSPRHNDRDSALKLVQKALADANLEPEVTVVGPSDESVLVNAPQKRIPIVVSTGA